MLLYENPHPEIDGPVDALDHVLLAAWFLSDLALDVFGLLFWVALGACLVTSLL